MARVSSIHRIYHFALIHGTLLVGFVLVVLGPQAFLVGSELTVPSIHQPRPLLGTDIPQ